MSATEELPKSGVIDKRRKRRCVRNRAVTNLICLDVVLRDRLKLGCGSSVEEAEQSDKRDMDSALLVPQGFEAQNEEAKDWSNGPLEDWQIKGMLTVGDEGLEVRLGDTANGIDVCA